jgi:GTPase SAR1 family protein
MAVIGMIGPHAVGKTTAARRWLKRYAGKLTLAVADDQWEETSEGRIRVRDWKGAKEDKATRAQFHRQRHAVTLIESARGFSTWLNTFGPDDPVIVLTCPEPVGRAFIEDRRRANGNPKPLSDYWTTKRLDYECNGHLLGWVRKLSLEQAHHFVIENRDRDWAQVDECFYRLFRKVYNGVVRRRAGKC